MIPLRGLPVGWKPSHCVFCGKKPRDKNKEHVIPRWLSLDSGADSTPALLENLSGNLRIPFKNVTLPACVECNSARSQLEGDTKRIFERVRKGSIFGSEIETLLDWTDKTRMALWFYMLSSKRGFHNVDPRFTIDDRVGKTDRMIWISLLPDSNVTGVGIAGPENLIFLANPSVAGILFRDVAIMSYSGTAVAVDYFGMTVSGDSTVENGHPVLSRTRSNKINLVEAERQVRIPSRAFIQFGKNTEELVTHVECGKIYQSTASDLCETAADAEFTIPRSSLVKDVAKHLWANSVYELQRQSFIRGLGNKMPDNERKGAIAALRDIDAAIDSTISIVNKISLFPYQRVSSSVIPIQEAGHRAASLG